MDFTLNTYKNLLIAFKQAGYQFFTFQQLCEGKAGKKFVILRHDVDDKAANSLKIAHIDNNFGIKSSFYFRVTPKSNNPGIMEKIVGLEHELGYHYEDLTLCNGNMEKAIVHFEKWLSYFRQFYPVRTICMNGNPLSKYDNRDLWTKYNYRDFSIIGEPYFDIDFNKVFYLTDTGRCWDGEKYSVRDKVQSSFTQKFHTTDQIIEALKTNNLPNQIMITTHPQRWTDNRIEWGSELVFQGIKNWIKLFLVKLYKN